MRINEKTVSGKKGKKKKIFSKEKYLCRSLLDLFFAFLEISSRKLACCLFCWTLKIFCALIIKKLKELRQNRTLLKQRNRGIIPKIVLFLRVCLIEQFFYQYFFTTTTLMFNRI